MPYSIQAIGCHISMRALVLKDTTIELTNRDDCFLAGIAHLILEFTRNSQCVHKIDLWSQESNRGVWNTDKILVLPEVTATFTVFVFTQADENGRQLLGSGKLNGRELLDTVGGQYDWDDRNYIDT
ncbi:hypothetical protein CPB86DRAFT_803045 [Serendipita vermifera]|nr:hypothetical protein CPB86DRAFT_803045 [Serendipita vermifera]